MTQFSDNIIVTLSKNSEIIYVIRKPLLIENNNLHFTF